METELRTQVRSTLSTLRAAYPHMRLFDLRVAALRSINDWPTICDVAGEMTKAGEL